MTIGGRQVFMHPTKTLEVVDVPKTKLGVATLAKPN
jgi:hypothetical protein